ncbi:MAG: SURF1 family protein [Acidimicrobiia bacterium]|nr:SURF1 family protein [Acidimicrobiia bacterium]
MRRSAEAPEPGPSLGTTRSPSRATYRFVVTPWWIGFHLLVAGAVVLMVNLGFWQLRRLDERQAFNDQVTDALTRTVAPIDAVLRTGVDPDAVEWRPVAATGTYLADEELRVVNRSQNGRPGDVVVTPLRLDDGRVLLVERGFVPLDDETSAAAPPDGPVAIVGRLRESEERRRGQVSDPSEGDLTEAQRLDIDRLAAQLPGEVVPMYVELESSDPPEAAGAPAPLAPPELTEGPHLSYAVQWFVFSICAVVGWVFAIRRSAASRRVSRAGAGASTTAVDEPAPASSD